MIYNFRHEKRRRDEIVTRIQNDEEISQGWGGGGVVDLDLRNDDFIAGTVAYHGCHTTRVPSNLTRMRQFQDGDLLVMPHLPAPGTVSIHIVDGDYPACYEYDESDDTHQNHRIKIRDSFGLGGQFSIYGTELVRYRTKLRALQLPVLPIPDFLNTFLEIVEAARANPGHRVDVSDLDDFLNEVSNEINNLVTDRLRDMPTHGGGTSFESLCEMLLQENGYTIERRNQYRDGGDIDLRCKRSRNDSFIFEAGEVTLFVQAKKHTGTTGRRAVEQVKIMLENEPHADGCVMSTADEFSDDAKTLARNEGIVLLNRYDICRLLMPHLSFHD